MRSDFTALLLALLVSIALLSPPLKALAAEASRPTDASPPANDQTARVTIGKSGHQPITYNFDGAPNTAVQQWLDAVPDGNKVTLDATRLHAPVRAVYAREPSMPLLNPGATWTGAINSGWANWKDCDGAPQAGFPTNPDTDTPRPIGQFRLVPWQRVGDGFVVTVKADGFAPVAYVDIIAEGGCTRVSTRSIYSYKGSDQLWHQVDGYHARVNLPAFLKTSRTGQVNLAAKVVSTDGSFTFHVIGREAPPAAGNSFLSHFSNRVVILPRAQPFSLRINVDPGLSAGCVELNKQATWPTPRAACKDPDLAMRLARGEVVNGVTRGTDQDVAPEIVAIETMTWNPKTWAYKGATGAESVISNMVEAGWPTLRAAPGATLTIRRPSFDDSGRDGLFWQPLLTPLRLQGPNVIHDQTNGGFLRSFARDELPFWYDGITVPVGDYDPLVYLRPDGQVYPNSVARYVTNGRYERGFIVLKNTANTASYSQGLPFLAWDLIANGTTGDLANSSQVFDNIVINNFGNYATFRDPIDSIRIWYDGPDPVATVWKAGNEGAGNGRIYLNQSSLAPNSQFVTNGDKRTLQQVADEVNKTYGAAGWHAELCTATSRCAGTPPLVVGDRQTDRHPIYIMNVGGSKGAAPINARDAGFVFKTRVDIHADLLQFRGGNRSQQMISNVRGLDWKAIQTGKMDGGNTVQNMSFVNIAIKPVDGDTFPKVRASYDVGKQHRQILLKNWFDGGSTWNITTYDGELDPHNVFTSIIVNRVGWNGAPKASPVMKDVLARDAEPGVADAVTHRFVANKTWKTADLYPRYANHDWSPAGPLVAKDNLKAPEPNVPFDIDGQLFRERDAMGPGAMRVGRETIGKGNAASTALVTYEAADDADAGVLTLTAASGPGDTGPTRTLTISVGVGR